jgi:hypothetical protein
MEEYVLVLLDINGDPCQEMRFRDRGDRDAAATAREMAGHLQAVLMRGGERISEYNIMMRSRDVRLGDYAPKPSDAARRLAEVLRGGQGRKVYL